MLPDEARLVGIAAGIVGCADGVEWRSVGCKGMTGNGDDDGVAGQPEKLAIVLAGDAGNEMFGGGFHGKPMLAIVAVKREIACAGDLFGQPDRIDQLG